MNDQLVLTLLIAMSLLAILLALAIDDQPPAPVPEDPDTTARAETASVGRDETVQRTVHENDKNHESEGDEDARRPAGLPATARR